MLQILWTSLGLFFQPKLAIEKLQTYSSKLLLGYGFTISITSILASNIAEVIDVGVSPHTVFLALIPYYIGTFLFMSVVLVCLMMISHKNINVPRFFGLYLFTDFPLSVLLPLSIIGMAFPLFSSITAVLMFIIILFAVFLKILVFKEFFHITNSQTIILWITPFILIIFWFVIMVVTVLNKSSMMF